MRLNIYAEELTSETKVVTKTVTDAEFGERTFYGVRVYLKSPPELHHGEVDDDRSAITFWVRWTSKAGSDTATLLGIVSGMDARIAEIDRAIRDDASDQSQQAALARAQKREKSERYEL